MKTCTTCGTEYPAGAESCPTCGTTTYLDSSPAVDEIEAAHEELPPSPLSTPAPPAPTATPAALSSEDRTWGLVAHVAAFAGFTAIPLANVLGPLVVYLMKREQSPYVADHARESLNFNISVIIYGVVFAILSLIGIGLVLLVVLGIAWFVLTIVAAVKASNGEMYRYPLTLRFVN